MSSPFPSPEVRRLARELADLRSMVQVLAGGQATSGSGVSSLDGGTWVVKDENGVVRQVHGAQADGTVTTVDMNAPAPPAPAGFTVTPVPGGLKVGYSGSFEGDEGRPADLKVVEIHVDLDPGFTVSDQTLDAALVGQGTVTFATDDYVPHTVRLVARNTSGVRSAPSGSITATPLQLREGDIGPGEVGTVNLDDGAVTPPKSGTGVTSNLVPDPGFNDAGWRAKRTAPPWGFVDAPSVGFATGDWAAYCSPTTTRAPLSATGAGGVPVIPGEVYYVAYDAARSASGAGLFWLEVTFYNADGTLLAVSTEDEIDPLLEEVRPISELPTSTFDVRHGQVTIPPGAATMRVVMVREDETGTSAGTLYLDRLEVRSVITRANTGQRVETSPTGVLVFGEDGQPVGSISADGSISMVSGQFDNSLTYGGTELSSLLDERARGEVARIDAGSGNSPVTTTEVEWLEMGFTAYSGRAYKLRSSGLIARNAGARGLQVRWTTDGTRPLKTSPVLTYNNTVQDGTLFLATDMGWTDGTDREVKMLFTVRSWDNTSSVYWQPGDLGTGFSVWVEDTGPRQPASGGVVTPEGTGTGGGGTAPPPAPVLRTFTTSWNCTWSQSWRFGNAIRQSGGRMWQGYISAAASYGDQASLFGFNMTDVRAKLAGATIKKLEIYLYAEHWYYNTGGYVCLGTSNVSTPPANFPGVALRRGLWHLNKPEGRWVDLGGVGIAMGNEIRDGSTGSFVLDARGVPARNLVDYGYFVGSGGGPGSTAPGLRVTYQKAV